MHHMGLALFSLYPPPRHPATPPCQVSQVFRSTYLTGVDVAADAATRQCACVQNVSARVCIRSCTRSRAAGRVGMIISPQELRAREVVMLGNYRSLIRGVAIICPWNACCRCQIPRTPSVFTGRNGDNCC